MFIKILLLATVLVATESAVTEREEKEAFVVGLFEEPYYDEV